MKLFRFIRNVWNGVWDSLFDGDLKDLLKSMCGYAICFGAFFGTTYGLGWLGKLIGLSWMMPPDKRDDMFGLGVVILGALLLIFFLAVAAFVAWIKLKDIWNKS